MVRANPELHEKVRKAVLKVVEEKGHVIHHDIVKGGGITPESASSILKFNYRAWGLKARRVDIDY